MIIFFKFLHMPSRNVGIFIVVVIITFSIIFKIQLEWIIVEHSFVKLNLVI